MTYTNKKKKINSCQRLKGKWKVLITKGHKDDFLEWWKYSIPCGGSSDTLSLFVIIYRAVHLKQINFTVNKLYLNKSDFLKKVKQLQCHVMHFNTGRIPV